MNYKTFSYEMEEGFCHYNVSKEIAENKYVY